jgi:glycine oxidase
MAEITILGAGVAGLAVATELAARGLRPRIIDRAGGPGAQGCSWWAGGMLAPFCEGETAEEPVVRLGQAAADWWQRRAGGVTRAGTLVLAGARDLGELDRFARRTVGHERIGANRIAELEPDLQGRARAALFFEQEAHLDPRTALEALAGKLAEQGVAIEQAEGDADAVTGPGGGEALVIDCRGWAARDALEGLRGVRGEMLVLRCPDVAITRTVRLLHPRTPIYLVPRGDGHYMLGATMIESARQGPITARSVLELLSAAYALHPAFAEAELVETGTEVRPAFADNLPRVLRRGQVIHVNGLYRHGYLMAPALARMVADLVTGGREPELYDADQGE